MESECDPCKRTAPKHTHDTMPSVKWAFDKHHGSPQLLLRVDHPVATPVTLTIAEDGRHVIIATSPTGETWEIALYGAVRRPSAAAPLYGEVPAIRDNMDGSMTFRLFVEDGGGDWPRITASRAPPPWLSVAWDLWHDEEGDDDEGYGREEAEAEEEEEDEDDGGAYDDDEGHLPLV